MEGDVESIEDRLAACVSRLNDAHRELVDIVAEAAHTDAWVGDRIRSLTHWMTWRAGVSPASASTLVRVAGAADTHPATMAVFADGHLTLDQVAAAVRAPAAHDRHLAEVAPLATVGQIRTIVRAASDPVTADPDGEHVSISHRDDGTVELSARLDADHGQLVDAALAAARDRLFRDGQADVTWADALVDICQRSLDTECPSRQERFKLHWYLDPTAPVPARWPNGIAIPDSIRQLLDCDGSIAPTFVHEGIPFSVGRSQRIVPARTRHQVIHRDQATCRVPWCAATRGLEIHHIEHWEHGHPTDTPNLITLCRSCHRRHHRGEFHLHGDADLPDGLTYTDRHGRPITRPKPRPRPPDLNDIVTAKPAYEHPLGERLDPTALYFTTRS